MARLRVQHGIYECYNYARHTKRRCSGTREELNDGIGELKMHTFMTLWHVSFVSTGECLLAVKALHYYALEVLFRLD